MTSSTDQELRAWIDEWQADTPAIPAADHKIRQYVQRRSRLLRVFAVTDTLIGAVFLVFLTHRALTHTDPFEKLAMGMLAVITVVATVFGWMNWRGAIASRGRDTATFVALSVSRVHRMERGGRAAWGILAAQLLVFVPWIWHRLHAGAAQSSLQRQLWSWGFLAVMVSLVAGLILIMQRWSRREARIVADLQRELTL